MNLRCVNADARKPEGYQEALQGRQARVLLTDPPYCLLTRRRKGGEEREKKGRKLDHEVVVRFETVRDYREFSRDWLRAAGPHLAPDALAILWTNFLGREPLLEAAREQGFSHLWGEYVWAKRTTERQGNEQLLRVYEVALVLRRTPPPVPGPGDLPLPWAVVAGYDDEGEAGAAGSHPHHKPFSSLEPLVRAFTRPGDLVLDPFAGSGSIPVAALRLGRQVACLELRPEWAAQVTGRLQREQVPPGPR